MGKLVSDYTPTTEEVRLAYGEQSNFRKHATQTFTQLFEEEDGEFDRWLAEVKAQAWEQGATTIVATMVMNGSRDLPANPYRQGEEQ